MDRCTGHRIITEILLKRHQTPHSHTINLRNITVGTNKKNLTMQVLENLTDTCCFQIDAVDLPVCFNLCSITGYLITFILKDGLTHSLIHHFPKLKEAADNN